jgi:glycine/D-amino acid oxidase-like deaminating enzyme
VFTNTGFLVGVRPQDVHSLKANLAMQQSVGIKTSFITTAELKELEPHIDPSGLGGGAYEPESGYCAPVEAITGFAQGVERLGGKVITGVRMTGLRRSNGKVCGIDTTQGFLPSGNVVIAAGPWSKTILSEIGVDIPMITARVKIGLYRRPPDFDRHRIWGDFVTQVYLRPETGGLMLVGSIAPDEETGDLVADPDTFNERVELDILTSFAERAAQRYPAMTRSHLASSYSSIYDITPDWHALLDAVPGTSGLYLCAGGSGHGFKLAPAVGRMVANLVLNGKKPEDEINLFSLERYQTGKLVRGQYEYSILG